MGVKSIVDIDVNDAKFKSFKEDYDKYLKALGVQAGMWAKAGQEQSKIADNFRKIAAQSLAQGKASQELAEAGKKTLNANRENDRLWTSMSRTTKDVSKNILSATQALAQWGGILSIVSGVLGVGGLFGINRMASSVAGQRTSAKGRGMSIGEQSAFESAFERYGLDGSFLDTVANLKSDPSQSVLQRMHVDGNGSTEEVAVNLLKAIRQRSLATPDNMLGLLDKQTGLNIGQDMWRRLGRGTSDDEFNASLKSNAALIGPLGINDKTARAYADFHQQMGVAGKELETTFANGLVGLMGPLRQLSEAMISLVRTIMGSQGMKDGIKEIAVWIKEFSAEIKSGEFQKNVRDFIQGVADMAHALRHPIDTATASIFGSGTVDYSQGPPKPTGLPGLGDGDAKRSHTLKSFSNWLKDLNSVKDSDLGLPEGTIDALIGNKPDANLGPVSPARQAAYEAQRRATYEELRSDESSFFSTDKVGSPAAVARGLQQYGRDHNINITILNNTAADVHVSTNNLAPAQ